MTKQTKKKKKEPLPAGPNFKKPTNFRGNNAFKGPQASQSFNRRPVNVVRHKG